MCLEGRLTWVRIGHTRVDANGKARYGAIIFSCAISGFDGCGPRPYRRLFSRRSERHDVGVEETAGFLCFDTFLIVLMSRVTYPFIVEPARLVETLASERDLLRYHTLRSTTTLELVPRRRKRS